MLVSLNLPFHSFAKWTASSEFGTYRLCEQRRFRRACASAQSRQNLRCSLIHAVSQEEPSDRKPDPWPLWMTGHAQLKFVMTECSKTQIRLTGLKLCAVHTIFTLEPLYTCIINSFGHDIVCENINCNKQPRPRCLPVIFKSLILKPLSQI